MTYAPYWIRQAVIRYIEKCGFTVRIPGNARQKIAKYKKAVEKLARVRGTVPTDSEVAAKRMAQIAREQELSLGRIRQIKEKGLRRLQMGKARRELLENFDITGAGAYRGGLNKYRESDFTSVVEYMAIKRQDAQEEYERHLREVEEMHRERTGRKT